MGKMHILSIDTVFFAQCQGFSVDFIFMENSNNWGNAGFEI